MGEEFQYSFCEWDKVYSKSVLNTTLYPLPFTYKVMITWKAFIVKSEVTHSWKEKEICELSDEESKKISRGNGFKLRCHFKMWLLGSKKTNCTSTHLKRGVLEAMDKRKRQNQTLEL